MTFTDVSEAPIARSNVDWAAILAGAAVATAGGLILLGFGAALGLSLTSPYDGEGLSPVAFAIAAGLYLLWVQVLSFFSGGYVAARLKARTPGVTEHETDVRDGLHGVLVWAVGVIAAAFIAFATVGGTAATAKSAEGSDAAAVRSVTAVVSEQVQESAAKEATTDATAANATTAERRAEVARKFSIISAFMSAAALLVGAAAAFAGAHSGGNHRDNSVVWQFFTSRERLIRVKT
jgi:hypothetical protein